MGIEQVMSKLAKLKATEVSLRDAGNTAAAESYAAKVSELLLRYQISMAEVDASVRDQDDPIDETYIRGTKRSRVGWENSLAAVIANANGCQLLAVQGSNSIWFVGRKSNREVATYLFEYLRREGESYSKKKRQQLYNWTKNHEPENIGSMHGWRASFLLGFVVALRKRFDDMRQSVVADIPFETMALVKADDALVNQKVQEITGGKELDPLKNCGGGNSHGFKSGKAFGSNVAIARGVDTNGGGQKSLT